MEQDNRYTIEVKGRDDAEFECRIFHADVRCSQATILRALSALLDKIAFKEELRNEEIYDSRRYNRRYSVSGVPGGQPKPEPDRADGSDDPGTTATDANRPDRNGAC